MWLSKTPPLAAKVGVLRDEHTQKLLSVGWGLVHLPVCGEYEGLHLIRSVVRVFELLSPRRHEDTKGIVEHSKCRDAARALEL